MGILVGIACVLVPASIALHSSQRSAMRLRELVLQLQAAADAERGRLSHELHDDVGQKLIALKMQLQVSRLPGATSVATHEASVALLDAIIGDIRSLSHTLRPAPFDEGQLIPALTALAKAEGRRAELCVLVDAPDDDVLLPRDVELACYGVVRESLANIVKHARARNVAISVACDSEAFAVSVADDGRGFDVVPVTRQSVGRGRLGLVGMQERVGHVGGTLTVRSHRGAGTTVACRIPVRKCA